MLLKEAARYFDSGVKSRGKRYYLNGHVHLGEFDEQSRIEATVVGTQPYTVTIDFDRRARVLRVRVDCSCPYIAQYGECCKHIWATLTAIEKHRQSELDRLMPRCGAATIELVADGEDSGDTAEARGGWHGKTADSLGLLEARFAPNGNWMKQVLDRFADKPHAVHRYDIPSGRATSQGSAGRKKRRGESLRAWQGMLRQLPKGTTPALPVRSADNAPIEPFYILDVENSFHTDTPVLSLGQRRTTHSGKLGKMKRLSLSAEDIARVPDKLDRRICLLLVGAGAAEGPYGYFSHYDVLTRARSSMWKIPQSLQSVLLPMLATTGRFMLREGRNDPLRNLTVDDGEPWEFVLSIGAKPEDKPCQMQGSLRRGAQQHSLNDVTCFLKGAPELFVQNDTLYRLNTHGCYPWLHALRFKEPTPITKRDLPKLLDELATLRAFPRIEWPASWDVREVHDLAPSPTLSLRIEQPDRFGSRHPASGDVIFHYGDISVDRSQSGRFQVDANSRRLIKRQLEEENRLLSRLLELGMRQSRYDNGFEIPPKKIPALAAALLTEGWSVLGNRRPYRSPGNFRINVSSGIDWFDLDGKLDFGGQEAALPELLAALEKGEQFVLLGDGSFGMLPHEWITRHQPWLEMGQAQDGLVRFSKAQMSLLDAMLAELPEASYDANFAAARKKLAKFSGIKPKKEPSGFCGALRPYQREALGWMHFLDEFGWGGCLADDMGLGKTVQLLAHVARRKQKSECGPSLVVAPKSVVFNWAREADRFTPALRVLNYTGSLRKQFREKLEQYDLLLTTYGTLRRDIEYLRHQVYDYVVLDEAQAIKNATSQSAKAARLLPARRRLALTGTPVENELADLWSLMEFLNPGMLGSAKAFKSFSGVSGQEDGDRARLPVLSRMMRPFILRRTKDQVARELPQRSEQLIHCALPSKQATYYKELREHYRMSLMARVDKVGLARSKMHVLEALLRLRQAACHPGLIDNAKADLESAKLEVLLPMIAELIEEGHKALIFSQFTKMLAILRRDLEQRNITYEYLDGRTRNRAEKVDRFQSDSQCPLFLISLKAGGTGLNLTAADYVFILDPWWNPAVEAQAIDRAHRIGQTKKVIAYRLIARDTVESKILELQQSKRDLADAIIAQQNSVIRTMTKDDLAALLT